MMSTILPLPVLSLCLINGQYLYFILPNVSMQRLREMMNLRSVTPCSLILINAPLIGRWLNILQLEKREAVSHKNT